MSDENQRPFRRHLTRQNVTIAGVIAAVPAVLGVKAWYVDWHDERYVQRQEAFLVADASEVKDQITRAQEAADVNASKLDAIGQKLSYIELQAAVSMVQALQQDLDTHLRTPNLENEVWLIRRDDLRRQVDSAREFRDCLMANRTNCDHLRIR